MDVDNLISGSSAFSKSSLNIWKFLVHILLKLSLNDFEHYFASVWDDCNCTVVWTIFGVAFLWDWDENWPFLALWPLLSLQIWNTECSTLRASSFRIWNSSDGIPKECSNYCTIALISNASKDMLKILQARLQHSMSQEIPDVQVGFRKGRGTRDQIVNIHWITEKSKRIPEKYLLLLRWLH